MKHWALWTAQEDLVLTNLVYSGYSAFEMADELTAEFGKTRTAHAIRQRKRKLKLPNMTPPAPLKPEKRARIMAYLLQGMKVRRIAEQLKTHETSILRTVQKLERDGLVTRTGKGRGVKFTVTKKWKYTYEDEADE